MCSAFFCGLAGGIMGGLIGYIDSTDVAFGGDLDGYASYAQRGNLPLMEHVFEAGMALMPMIGKAKVLRS